LTGWQRIIGRSLVALVAALAVASGAPAAAPRPGSLDQRFGDDGRLTGQIGCVPVSVAGIERAGSAGGFRVIGSTERSSPDLPGESGRLIMRGYDRRGRLDRAVGGTGTVAVSLPGGPAKASGVARQPDGKLVVVGSVGDDFPDPKQDVFVARFHPDGSLDAQFGDGGVVTTDLGALSGEVARDVVVQPDGRLVVAASGRFESGVLYPKRSTDLVVLRYTSAGTLDPDFASGGVLHVPSESDGAYFVPAGLVQGSDGTILVGGDTGLTHRDNNTGAIAQVRTDGSLDGIVRFSGQWTSSGMSFDARRDRIYLAGSMPRMRDGLENVMSVVAVRERDLSLDPGFGVRGLARVNLPHTEDDFATAVISDTRGRVVLAGGAAALPPRQTSGPAPRSRFAVARFTAAGRLDRRFGRRGMTRVDFPQRQSVAHALLEQPAGRLVVAGIGGGTSRFVRDSTGCALAVARLAAR